MSATESICLTRSNIKKHILTWKIDQFSAYTIMYDVIKSLIFPDNVENNIRWCLSLHPKRYYGNAYYTCIAITLVSSSNTKIELDLKIKIKICLLDYENNKFYETEKTENLKGRDDGYEIELLNLPADQIMKKCRLYLADQLTVYCEVTVIGPVYNLNFVQSKVIESALTPQDFEPWLNNEELSDVTLAVEDKEFKAHKIMLSVRSPVFAAMFKHDMAEKLDNRVNITDMTHGTLKELLTFIYTGRVDDDNVTGELLSAADKYELKQLKVMCEDVLSKKLSVENAAEHLILADLHSCERLKYIVSNFIMNTPQVMDTEGWQNLLKSPHAHILSLLIRTQPKLLAERV